MSITYPTTLVYSRRPGQTLVRKLAKSLCNEAERETYEIAFHLPVSEEAGNNEKYTWVEFAGHHRGWHRVVQRVRVREIRTLEIGDRRRGTLRDRQPMGQSDCRLIGLVARGKP
jgi:hypothetical protein